MLPRMPQNKQISVFDEVAKPEHQSTKLSNNWIAATHYAPDENLEGIDIGVLDHAKDRVDVAMYSFTDRPIERELKTLAKHKVQIRLYRDQEQYREEKLRAQERGEVRNRRTRRIGKRARQN